MPRFLAWVVASGLLALFYGPLFAWSPITPGFVRTTLGDVVYLHRTARPLTRQHARVAAEMARLEHVLGMSFHGPVNVVLCDEASDMRRFTPWLSEPPGLGARTLQFGTVVYVSPLVRDRGDAGAFIRHELVHVLLLRNTPLVARVSLLKHWWLLEGLSVHYGNPDSYPVPSRGRLTELRPLQAILDPDVSGQGGEATVAERYALAGAFVGDLMQRKSAVAWSMFLHALVNDPTRWRGSFERAFGESFDSALQHFERSAGGSRGPAKIAA